MFFTCSTFGLKRRRIEQLASEMVRRRLRVSWRTETRVDSPTIDYIDELAECGLSVLDIGLESASPEMIRRMNKTRQDPERYLAQAGRFIARVAESDKVLLKVNIVFHAGESPATLADTMSFLLTERAAIDSVSAGPVMMYPGTELAENFERYAAQFGTSFIPGRFWDIVHAYKVNPSHELSFDQLNCVAAILSKIITDEPSYFAVKAHGQLPLLTRFEEWRTGNRAYDPSTFHHSVEYDPGGAACRTPFAGLPDFVPAFDRRGRLRPAPPPDMPLDGFGAVGTAVRDGPRLEAGA
jgi:hypothetical protein